MALIAKYGQSYTFDLIYTQNTVADEDLPFFLKLKELLRPGGYIEIIDVERACSCGSASMWTAESDCETCGSFASVGERLDLMREAGFRNPLGRRDIHIRESDDV